MRIFFIALLLMIQISSQAETLRCFDFFATHEKGTIQYNAEFLDSLNQQNNQMLFSQSVLSSLQVDKNSAKNYFDLTQKRWTAFKLRRAVKQLNESGDWDRYDFDHFSKKLERFAFLMDESVPAKLSSKDRVLFLQAQHSLLSQGLEKFFFDTATYQNRSMRKKFFDAVMTPFNMVYMRWTTAWMIMPKLNGSVVPLELAQKIAWDGLDAHREELSKYRLNAEFKKTFNVFSVVYNWSVVTAVFVGLPVYAHFVYQDLVQKGNAQVQQIMAPLMEQSQKAAETDYQKVASEKMKANMLELFRMKYQREPNADELKLIDIIVAKKSSLQSATAEH